MEKKYIVKLTSEERAELKKLVSNGNVAVKRYKIAQVLLRADSSSEGSNYTDEKIRSEVGVSPKTIARIRQKFVEGGMAEVFRKKFTPRYGRRKLDGEGEAKLIALCCSKAPAGRARWTLQLLADRAVELKIVDAISDDTVMRVLKKTNLNPGRKKNGAYLQRPMQNSFAGWKMC